MSGLLILAAETSAPSKTPFYIAGALLVLFALGLSALGLRSETFPPSRGGRTVVIAVALVLVAATMATAVLTS